MSFSDYFFMVVFIIAFLMLIVFCIWRITCFFKKSCTWKGCPYRHNYHLSRPIGWVEEGCRKFPPTDEEIEEENRKFDQLEALVEQLSKENKQAQQKKD